MKLIMGKITCIC